MYSGDGIELTEEHLGKRVIYTDREGKGHFGTVRHVATGSGMIDIDLDHSSRARYYVPCDTVTFVPDAAQEQLG
jgi:hypothetical protein